MYWIIDNVKMMIMNPKVVIVIIMKILVCLINTRSRIAELNKKNSLRSDDIL